MGVVEVIEPYDHCRSVSVQVAMEMPFKIKTIECPTHNIKMKVSGRNIFHWRGRSLCKHITLYIWT